MISLERERDPKCLVLCSGGQIWAPRGLYDVTIRQGTFFTPFSLPDSVVSRQPSMVSQLMARRPKTLPGDVVELLSYLIGPSRWVLMGEGGAERGVNFAIIHCQFSVLIRHALFTNVSGPLVGSFPCLCDLLIRQMMYTVWVAWSRLCRVISQRWLSEDWSDLETCYQFCAGWDLPSHQSFDRGRRSSDV